jgi:hypothetical protein
VSRPEFGPGDLVVCVDASPLFTHRPPLVQGAVYIVEALVSPAARSAVGYAAAWGAHLQDVPRLGAAGYFAGRFRKLEPRPLDVFTGAGAADSVPALVPAMSGGEEA